MTDEFPQNPNKTRINNLGLELPLSRRFYGRLRRAIPPSQLPANEAAALSLLRDALRLLKSVQESSAAINKAIDSLYTE